MWEWEDTSFRYDFCGHGWGREFDRHILDMAAFLRPVPVSHPGAGTSGRAFPFRVNTPEPVPDGAARARIRAEFGLGPQDRLVMVPVSEWQQPTTVTKQTTEMMVRLGERVPELLAAYLSELPDRTHLLLVGPRVPAFDRMLPAHRLHYLPPSSPQRYRELLACTDLLLSLSMSGLTAARAVLMGVPAVLLTNRFTVSGEADLDALDASLGGLTRTTREWLRDTMPIDPFRHWPKGLFHFVDSLVADNPYLSALAAEELLDHRVVVERMRALLYDPAAGQTLARARNAYIDLVDSLPPVAETFADAIAKACATAS